MSRCRDEQFISRICAFKCGDMTDCGGSIFLRVGDVPWRKRKVAGEGFPWSLLGNMLHFCSCGLVMFSGKSQLNCSNLDFCSPSFTQVSVGRMPETWPEDREKKSSLPSWSKITPEAAQARERRPLIFVLAADACRPALKPRQTLGCRASGDGGGDGCWWWLRVLQTFVFWRWL